MNKTDFTILPTAIALGLIYDAMPALQHAEAPRVPQSPKYDSRMKTKGGYVYCSECDLSQLRYYLDRCSKPGDPKYAPKNERDAKALGYFIAWREQNPDALWVGERYQQGQVKALAPSSRPRVSDWDDGGPAPSAQVSHGGGGELDGGDDSDIPFILNVTSESRERWHHV